MPDHIDVGLKNLSRCNGDEQQVATIRLVHIEIDACDCRPCLLLLRADHHRVIAKIDERLAALEGVDGGDMDLRASREADARMRRKW